MRKEVTPTETQINVLTVELAENLKHDVIFSCICIHTCMCLVNSISRQPVLCAFFCPVSSSPKTEKNGVPCFMDLSAC